MATKTTIFSLAIFIILIFGAALLLTTNQKRVPEKITFSVTDGDRPMAVTPEIFADLGEMKVADVKQKDFVLQNIGTKPLQILNINSSCNCISGRIVYRETTSREFGMHAQSGFVTEIAASSSAVVRAIYRPAIMPVFGPVERAVYVDTNDPERAKLVFTVKANVK